MSLRVSGCPSASTQAEHIYNIYIYFFFHCMSVIFLWTKYGFMGGEPAALPCLLQKLWPPHFTFRQPASGLLPRWSQIASIAASSLGTYSIRHTGALNQVSAGFQSNRRSVILPLSPVLHQPITHVDFIYKNLLVILSPWRSFPGSLRESMFLGRLCIGL